jgi:DNA polymerase
VIINGTDYLLATLDFESFYGTGCTLTTLNTFEYVTHPEFTIHGVGLKLSGGKTQWYDDTEDALAAIENAADGKPIALLCQNTYFDGWILHYLFDWHPDLYLDTMGMSRGMFPTSSASLDKLAERLWPDDPTMRKGKELVQFRNVTTEALRASPTMMRSMIIYCDQDCDLTYAAFMRMLPFYPDSELELIHLTLQMMCEPILHVDVQRVVECLANAIAKRDELLRLSGVAITTLSSNTQFARWIEARGIPVPMKPSPTKKVKDADGKDTDEYVMIPALGKADLGFQELRNLYPDWEHVWAGRVAAKSVGEITRAQRFIDTAGQCNGYMPVALGYYAAHTGRYGGRESLNLQNLGRGSELRRSLCVPTRKVAA